jgi:AcrR family transcriptional regulator
VTTPASVPDGRSARSQRTRAAVVDALLALIHDGHPRPTARQIAERAEISLRSVYVHFDDLEDLFCAAAQRQMAAVAPLLVTIERDAPLGERVEQLCAARARIYEQVGPVGRAAELQAPFSPTLSRLLTRVREASKDEIGRLFEPELARLRPPARSRRLAALDAALSAETWHVLRSRHGMSFAESRTTMVESATRLLAEGRR